MRAATSPLAPLDATGFSDANVPATGWSFLSPAIRWQFFLGNAGGREKKGSGKREGGEKGKKKEKKKKKNSSSLFSLFPLFPIPLQTLWVKLRTRTGITSLFGYEQ